MVERWSQCTVDRYMKDGGDEPFRINHYTEGAYRRNPQLFLEIGACDGAFTEALSKAYPDALIVAVEPVPALFDAAQKRLAGRPNVALTNAGLWSADAELPMLADGPASRIVDEPYPQGCVGKFFDIARWIRNFSDIDVLIMNVEGAEYELLPRLINSGTIERIRNVQVQFHDLDNNSPEAMEIIQSGLAETHFLTYQYPFCMENWRRKWA